MNPSTNQDNWLSPHVSLVMATHSATAIAAHIANIPNIAQIEEMRRLAINIIEPILLKFPYVVINSMFRTPELNLLVGSKNRLSQHIFGQAVDLTMNSRALNEKLFVWIGANLKFDQLINESKFSWVHISYRANYNRNEILTL